MQALTAMWQQTNNWLF